MKILAGTCAMIALLLLAQSVALQRADALASPRVAFVADQAAGIGRIVIDGKEVARFTTDGLDVPGDIKFGGVMTDTVSSSGTPAP